MITLFEARDNLYKEIKKQYGFKGITVNQKLAVGGLIVVLVTDFETKESLHNKYGDMYQGYYVDYVIKGNGIEFS